ncbi:uncharacterized protein [Dermacentor andersoni]|uniref:uncharacterized protein n=1 Tax=Dermacentor andersoni TaxID=34620 RepID=UPI002417FCE3|nr:uncharacterized protein LOC129387179 [Dermacentor andersoni]
MVSDQGSFCHDESGGILKKKEELEGVQTGARSTPCHLEERKEERNNVDQKRKESVNSKDALAGSRIQPAAVLHIQRWIRTRFQPWLRKRQALPRGGPLKPVSEGFHEDLEPATDDENEDFGTTVFLVSDQESFSHDESGGVLLQNEEVEGVQTGARSTPWHLDEGKQEGNDVDQKRSESVESSECGKCAIALK